MDDNPEGGIPAVFVRAGDIPAAERRVADGRVDSQLKVVAYPVVVLQAVAFPVVVFRVDVLQAVVFRVDVLQAVAFLVVVLQAVVFPAVVFPVPVEWRVDSARSHPLRHHPLVVLTDDSLVDRYSGSHSVDPAMDGQCSVSQPMAVPCSVGPYLVSRPMAVPCLVGPCLVSRPMAVPLTVVRLSVG